jgi:hypothetical protein
MTTENIASRCMLAYLSISQWSARKLDKSATNEVTANHAASADAGRFNKQTIPKEALLPIQQIASQARLYLYDHTLPWSDNGDRALSSELYFDVMQRLSYYQTEFNAEVDEFCKNYNQHRERARLKLNSLFKDSDYPSEHEVRSKFNFEFGVMPLPTASDFRVAMADDVAEEVRQKIQSQLDARVNTMMGDVWTQLGDALSHLRDRLQSSGKLFDSTLTNVLELLSRLPGLNITNDADLERMRVEIASALQGLSMKDIKKDEQLRKAVAEKADDIMRQMAGLV